MKVQAMKWTIQQLTSHTQQCVSAGDVNVSCVPLLLCGKTQCTCPYENKPAPTPALVLDTRSQASVCLLLHTGMCVFELCAHMCVPGMATHMHTSPGYVHVCAP